MKKTLSGWAVANSQWPIEEKAAACAVINGRSASQSAIGNVPARSAFSLVEILVVVSLLSLVVLVLMSVFNSTQTAFRAGVTQTDVLESSRMAMGLITADLKLMAAAGGTTTNLFALDNNSSATYASIAYTPLTQSLPGEANPNTQRTNLLNYCFFLTKNGLTWTGIGYVVNPTNTTFYYPLYRYAVTTNINSAGSLYNDFLNKILTGQWTNTTLTHLVDGVVDFRLHAYDPNGYPLTANYLLPRQNIAFVNPATTASEGGYIFYSNSLPAAVEIQIGVLEDRVLKRALSIPVASAQSNYLAQQVGHVRIFRQRVTIPNVDRTVYQ